MGQSNNSPPSKPRIAYYRGMAAEALRLAQSAHDEAQKASYVDIAARWNLLATEAERRMKREKETRADKSRSQSNGDRQ